MMDCLQPALQTRLYTAEQTRQLDRTAIEKSGVSGFELMSKAGRAAYRALQQRWPGAQKITVLCGPGNNGGDGLVLAGLALRHRQSVQVLMVGGAESVKRLQGEALQAYQWATEQGVELQAYQPGMAIEADVLVDALLGTGLSGEVRGDYVDAIQQINSTQAPVLTIDIPSGLCADSGRELGCAVRADLTISFIGRKQGLMTHQGVECRGQLLFDNLGVDEWVYRQVDYSAELIDPSWLQQLPLRPLNSHKGNFGHLLVIAGGQGMAGAGLMAAEAALGSGAGLVSLATHPEHVLAANIRCPEVMASGVRNGHDLLPLLEKASVVLIGPGLGQTAWAEQLLQQVMLVLQQRPKPIIVDADALNLLSRLDLPQLPLSIITPHPAEAARLLGCTTAEIQADRFAAVKALQARCNGVAVLKGAGTLVNDGQRTLLCQHGNPGMSSGGMGDVLAGIIAGLLSQQLTPLASAAIGVDVHARAADQQAVLNGERGMKATQLIDHLGALLNPQRREYGL